MFEYLPTELLYYIFNYLYPNDLISFSNVNLFISNHIISYTNIEPYYNLNILLIYAYNKDRKILKIDIIPKSWISISNLDFFLSLLKNLYIKRKCKYSNKNSFKIIYPTIVEHINEFTSELEIGQISNIGRCLHKCKLEMDIIKHYYNINNILKNNTHKCIDYIRLFRMEEEEYYCGNTYRYLYNEIISYIYENNKIRYYYKLCPDNMICIIIYVWGLIMGKSMGKINVETTTRQKKEYICNEIIASGVKINRNIINQSLLMNINIHNELKSLINYISY
ncbi:F-box domain-containing protein [Orpheovirus IHUMI-LCC2]|uniref:F-box domain-containing protein n=1 Tax=Orpheovirus IHUMI-LCC2 TaxID=2023057 RepID=A0A2I2L354_9VIRU|nr:F-box domain-containing protein [Orpheovirus IHUMI-LCC2]SNW61947.1 F-box domain-containing protein [Orpheovirus IHUMI-LCC2]